MRSTIVSVVIVALVSGCAVAPPPPRAVGGAPLKVGPMTPPATAPGKAGVPVQAINAPPARAPHPRATGTIEDARRHMLRGMAAVEMAKSNDDLALAEDEFVAATEIAPQLASAWFNLGKVRSQLGRYGEAIDSYREYLLAAPGAEDAQRVRDEIVKLEFRQEQADREKGRAGSWVGADGTWYQLTVDGNRLTLKTDSRRVPRDEAVSTYTIAGTVPITAFVRTEYQLVLRGNRLAGTWNRGPIPADKCTIPADTAEAEGELRDRESTMVLRHERTSFKATTQMSLLGSDSCSGVASTGRKVVEEVLYGPLGRGGLGAGVGFTGLHEWWDGGLSAVKYGWQGRLGVRLKDDTEAYAAGLRNQDEILAIDGVAVSGLSAGEALLRLHGEPKSRVELEIRRKGEKTPLTIAIRRL